MRCKAARSCSANSMTDVCPPTAVYEPSVELSVVSFNTTSTRKIRSNQVKMEKVAFHTMCLALAALILCTSSCEASVHNGSCIVGEAGGSCVPSPLQNARLLPEIFANPLSDAESSLLGRLEREVSTASFAKPSVNPLLAPARAVVSGFRGEHARGQSFKTTDASPGAGLNMGTATMATGGVAAAAALSPGSILFSGGGSSDLGLF